MFTHTTASLRSLLASPLLMLLCLVCCWLAGSAAAQGKESKNPSAPVERKVVTDDEGYQQWAPYKAAPCVRCNKVKQHECQNCKDREHAKKCLECGTKKKPMTRKSPCRLCAGEGTMPDALLEAPCIGCFGSSVFTCDGCGGNGNYPVAGGGKKRQKCAVCKGAGALKCSVCKGKRRCAALSIRKGLANASLKDLRAAETALSEMRETLYNWQPTGVKPRDELKLHQRRLKTLSKYAKVAKKASSMIKSIHSSVSKMDQYIGHEDRKSNAFKRFAQYNAFYIDHQLQAVKLAIKRAEHNAATKEAKGK